MSFGRTVRGLCSRVAAIRWSDLRALGNSRLIASSFIWFVVAGLAARSINALDSVDLEWSKGVEKWATLIRLPRSLEILWMMSIAFCAA